MKIKNCMTRNPVTIKRAASVQDALELMKKHSIRHLPVVEEGNRLVGFITSNDLRQFYFPAMVEDIQVHDMMVLNPITVNLNVSIEQAARLIHDYKIGGLPVLDKKTLVGIITASDLLSAFIEIMGILKVSSRIDVMIDKKGGVEEVSRIISEHDCEIISVATENQASRRKVHYFRLEKCKDLDAVIAALEDLGHKVLSVME